MKIFGMDLFGYRPPKEEYLYNFARWGFASDYGYIGLVVERQMDEIAVANGVKPSRRGRKKKTEERVVMTPKGIYHTKALNKDNFRIITDHDYLEKQIKEAQEKLDLIPRHSDKKFRWPLTTDRDLGRLEAGPVEFGRQELESIIERLKNRSKLSSVEKTVEKYPHTSSQLIAELLERNKHLGCKKADSFVPDFPTEAIKAMKEYDEMCVKVCGQKTHFYVIACNKDFEQRNKRRDPILLAQSPFGFFWQILGAWDEEMVYLGDL